MCHCTIFALFYLRTISNISIRGLYFEGLFNIVFFGITSLQSLYLERLKHEGAYFWNFTVCCQMCLHVCHVHYLSKVHHEWKKCLWSVFERWIIIIEEMILTLAGQAQWWSHVHLKSFRYLQQASNPWPLWCQCNTDWAMKLLRCEQVNL